MKMNQLVLLQGFIVMPFLCYYLQVHDCMIAILGIVLLIISPKKTLSPRWLEWDRGIPGLGFCHTRCEPENYKIFHCLLYQAGTCIWAPLFHLSGKTTLFLYIFIHLYQVGKIFFLLLLKGKILYLFYNFQLQWIPQHTPTIHNDQVCTLPTFRQGLQTLYFHLCWSW